MKKSLLILAAICCTMMASAVPAHRVTPQKLAQQTITVCQLDSEYYYYGGELQSKTYYNEFNEAGFPTALSQTYLSEDGNWYDEKATITYNERNQMTLMSWYWFNGTDWAIYFEEIYEYDANGATTSYTSYYVEGETRTGDSHTGIVVNGDTISNVTYRWTGYEWIVYSKIDTVRTNSIEAIISYRPANPQSPDGNVIPMSKTENAVDNDGTYTVSSYRYNDGWSLSSQTVSNTKINPDSTLSYSMQGADLVLRSKNIYTYDEAGQILTNSLYQLDMMSGVLVLNRVETYVYDANGNEISYTSEGYNGGAISFGNKRVSTYDANGNLIEVLNLGYDAINQTFTQNQGKMEYKYDENGNMIFYANYSYNEEKGFYATMQEEYEFDENGNLTHEKYYNLDWITYELNVGEEFEYFFTCSDIDDALENIESTNKSVKVIVDGQLYIIRDNVVYNTQGQIVK